jgi:hypothetical protein
MIPGTPGNTKGLDLMTRILLAAVVALSLAVMGCGDPVHRMLADPALRSKLFEAIGADSTLTRELSDRLLAEDGSRSLLFERLLGMGEARQALLVDVARDRVLLDGVIQFAVQDTAMRGHILTLFKGMQMAGAK